MSVSDKDVSVVVPLGKFTADHIDMGDGFDNGAVSSVTPSLYSDMDVDWGRTSADERKAYVRKTIDLVKRAEMAFVEAGLALFNVKENELYVDAGYKNFTSFAETEFGYKKTQAYRIIETALLAYQLHTDGLLINTKTQFVFRELEAGLKRIEKLEPEDHERLKKKVLVELDEIDRSQPLTSNDVKTAVGRFTSQDGVGPTRPEKSKCGNVDHVAAMALDEQFSYHCYGKTFTETVNTLGVHIAPDNDFKVNAELSAAMLLDLWSYTKQLEEKLRATEEQAKQKAANTKKPTVKSSEVKALPASDKETAEKPVRKRKSKVSE